MSTSPFLTLYMTKGDSRVKHVSREAPSDGWVRMIGAVKALNIDKNQELYLAITTSRDLLRGDVCPQQTGHSDFEVLERRNVGGSGWFLCLPLYVF